MMTQKRVLIFIKGIFDTMDLFTDELIQAFEKKGIFLHYVVSR